MSGVPRLLTQPSLSLLLQVLLCLGSLSSPSLLQLLLPVPTLGGEAAQPMAPGEFVA